MSTSLRLVSFATVALLTITPAGVSVNSAGAVPTPAPPAPVRSRVVMVYGDSIVHAATPFLRAELARYGVNVLDASVGGTAPCDALQFVDSDMVRFDPVAVVIAYVGNGYSPCINGTTGESLFVRHFVDTQRLVDAVGARPIVLATPPGEIGQGHYTAYDVLVYEEASAFGARLADTAAALIDPATRRFGKSMPCEMRTICRRIDVRGDDNYHLTAAGGYLYARVLTRVLVRRLRLTPA